MPKEECRKHLLFLQETLTRIGFIVNRDKSQLHPSQRMEWLGAEWDSEQLMIKLPEKKAGVIASLAHSLLSLQETDRLSWERLLGHLAFAAQISPEMNLQKKLLGPILNKFGEDTEVVFLPKATLKILAWWSLPGNLQKWTPLRSPPPSLFLFTDACEKGWGGPRWPRKVGSRELGGRVSKPPYEYVGVKSGLSSTLQLSSPSRVFHQAFLGQFNNCPSHKETRVLSVVGGYLGSRRDFPSVSGEGALHRPLEDQGQSQCPCGCSVEGLSPSRGMGTGSIGQREGSEGLPRNRNRHYGNSLQCNSAEVCEPLLPPSSSSHRRMGSGLEPMGGHLLLPASFTSSASICESDVIQGQHDPSPERPPVSLHPSHPLKPFLVKVMPLALPPRQRVRGAWVLDGRHKSSPWTVFRFSGPI